MSAALPAARAASGGGDFASRLDGRRTRLTHARVLASHDHIGWGRPARRGSPAVREADLRWCGLWPAWPGESPRTLANTSPPTAATMTVRGALSGFTGSRAASMAGFSCSAIRSSPPRTAQTTAPEATAAAP